MSRCLAIVAGVATAIAIAVSGPCWTLSVAIPSPHGGARCGSDAEPVLDEHGGCIESRSRVGPKEGSKTGLPGTYRTSLRQCRERTALLRCIGHERSGLTVALVWPQD